MNLEQKIDQIHAGVNEIKIEVAKCIVKLEQQRVELDDHKERIDELETIKNKGLGIATIIGAGVGVFIGWLLKQV